MSVAVEVQVATSVCGVPQPEAFRHWARTALAQVPEPLELTIRVVGWDEGAELNARYRGESGATNVLSFSASLPPGVRRVRSPIGDLVICADVVVREAHEQGKCCQAHFAHMVVHGALHLLGHDHEDEDAATAMEALEVRILDGLGYANPYLTAGSTAGQ